MSLKPSRLSSATSRQLRASSPTLRRSGSFGSRSENWWNLADHVPSVSGSDIFQEQWSVTDSLVDISPENYLGYVLKMPTKHKHFKQEDIETWLNKDTSNGFIRVYNADSEFPDSELIQCNLSLTAQKLSLQLGLVNNALHVQYSGDVIRRLEPNSNPLVLQNDYLTSLGYTDILRIQREGTSEGLASLIKFYSGKPFVDYTYVKNSMATILLVRKGKVFRQWSERLCVLSGTQLFIYRERTKRGKPVVVQLCKGSVEVVRFKDHSYALKITTAAMNDKAIYLAMKTEDEFLKWLRKFRKATSKLPTSTDLSNCHLECMPETVFVNSEIKTLNLRKNCMRERPSDDESHTIGWINDLNRFTKLSSLNLSDNDLGQFPVTLCGLITLVELNMSSNKIHQLPPEIGLLKNLEILHLHNNRLAHLPDDLIQLSSLNFIILAFNKFTSISQTLLHLSEAPSSKMTTIVLSGNDIEKIGPEQINRMKNVTRLSLQMNKLTLRPTETVKFSVMEKLTYLDIRHNKVRALDVRCVRTLEHLNCERNGMTSLQLNGTHLKYLRAAHNYISTLVINPKPEWLEHFDVSHNRLSALPEFLASCFFMKTLLANHNKIKQIPDRLLCDASALKVLALNHNQLALLPSEVSRCSVEELYLHRNQLETIPAELLAKSNKLRILNVSRNKLSHLPPPHESEYHNKLQELYLSHNHLRDDVMDVIGQYPRLKVLHIAYNKLHELCEVSLSRLELLRELNISGNRLKVIPEIILHLSHLMILRAHSNLLKHVPTVQKLTSLKILDVGSNQLTDLSVGSLVDSQLNLLDMSLNNQLSLSMDDINALKNKKSVNFVDITGMNRSLPGIPQAVQGFSKNQPEQPWQLGLAETSGSRNRLCVAILKNLALEKDAGHVFAMVDGGLNEDIAKLLLQKLPAALNEEFAKNSSTPSLNLKYVLLACHRNLNTVGQKLGAATTVIHLSRTRGDCYTLTVANSGDVEAVLSRNNEVILLTRSFTVTEDREELDRIKSNDGLITEDNRIYGTSHCTRLIGCSYLHPHVVPDPHVCTLNLGPEDRFIIIANRCLWNYMTYQEVVLEVLQIKHPVLAAKKLQDVAQAYGCKENLGILVIYLRIGRGEGTWDISIYDDQFYLQESSDEGSLILSDSDARNPEGTMRLKPLGAKRYVKKDKAGEWENALQKRLATTVKERELESSVESINHEKMNTNDSSMPEGEWRLSSAGTNKRFMKKDRAGLAHLNRIEVNSASVEEIAYPIEYANVSSHCGHNSANSSSSESLASTLCDEDGEYRKVDAYLNSLLVDGPPDVPEMNGSVVSLSPRVFETEEQEMSMELGNESDVESSVQEDMTLL